MATNPTEFFKVDERCVVNIQLAEKCQSCEIYTECVMCMETHVLNKNMFTNYSGLHSKRQSIKWKHTKFFAKKNVFGALVSKEGHIHSLLWLLFRLVWFYGISTSIGELMLNPFYSYKLNLNDLVSLGFRAYQPLKVI